MDRLISLALAFLIGGFLGAFIHDKLTTPDFEARLDAALDQMTKQNDELQAKDAEIIKWKEAASERQKERIVYRTQIKDTCPLSADFRLLHDAAAQDVVPRASGSDDPGTTPQDVAATVDANYGTYHQVAKRLGECQAYIKSLSVVSP